MYVICSRNVRTVGYVYVIQEGNVRSQLGRWPVSTLVHSAPDHIQFNARATLTRRSLHTLCLSIGPYLTDDLHCAADIPSRQRLGSASSLRVEVPRTRLATASERSVVAGSHLWNSLPRDVTDCETVKTFCRQLIHFLSSLLFP